MSQLALNLVSKYFVQGDQRTTILQNCSFDFWSSHSYAISGSSGVGKSTVMHMLAGLEAPSSGTITFNHAPLTPDLLHWQLGVVFQTPHLMGELTAWENVALQGLIWGNDLDIAQKLAHDLLAQVGLTQRAQALPAQLSGGEQQRVAIARALYGQPSFLLADEPTGNLDPVTGQQIIELLVELQHQRHMGLIIFTHDNYVLEKLTHKLHLSNAQLKLSKLV